MNLGLGSVRGNAWASALLAAMIAGWGVVQAVTFHRSNTVDVVLEARDTLPPIPLFGGRFSDGNIVELTVDRQDLGHLQGFVTFCGYAVSVTTTLVLLFGLFFLYRFCVDVIEERPFSQRANVNLVMVSVAVIAFAVLPMVFDRLGTNSVIGALDLDAFDAHGSTAGVWVALGIAVFLQLVFATLKQGARLEQDSDGLV
ncbi:hypothetical protein C5142_15005 [Rhodococcus sp. BGS-1C]|jgi:hypothetical protein|uniref:hypothetical protein n=1 Tax=Nocardiaceae TaxID=85025 RepID=UPI0019D0C745|nr:MULTISPECIES: hypothetical protein [Rhodococcus]MCC8927597.1 hypothetical protein [Rhodococcus sp. I2R]MCZ4275612.1 hypothetical protein [Rhodococcus yunnanensis]